MRTLKINKQKIKTSKGTLQCSISGNGTPPVVLINGGSGPIEGWMKILPEVSELSSVFSYNRFGVAGSDKPAEPQNGFAIVQTLREALQTAGLQPPFVLVGHSLGGLYANLYARLYPNEAAAIVFLESSHPKDVTLDQYQGTAVKVLNKMLTMGDSLFASRPFKEVYFVKETAEQINQFNTFPDIPVHVITGGKQNRLMPEEVKKKRLDHQLELLLLSRRSKHILAEKSGHFPQLSEPHVVIEAIADCLKQLKSL